MNYYIITSTKYSNINKDLIQFRQKSMDKSKVLVVTTEDISGYIITFLDDETCSQYTFSNHLEWVGDGTGVETMDFFTPYIQEVDD